MNILVVEDEDSIREFMIAYLKQAGYTILEASEGESALKQFRQNKIDLVLLDLNLPKVDGITVSKAIRKESQVPIMMVTARIEEIDELIGLEVGADDYIRKPFSPSILVARVQALLRRFAPNTISLGALQINSESREVLKHGKVIPLTTTQFNILYTLSHRAGRVFTRSEILDHAYDSEDFPDIFDRTVDAHIKSIRKAIEDDVANPKYIITVIGKGYKASDGS